MNQMLNLVRAHDRSGVERSLQRYQVGRAEDHAVPGGDVDKIQVDTGSRDLTGEVCKHAGPVLDVHHDDLTLATDRQLGDRQGMLRRLRMWDQNVEFGP